MKSKKIVFILSLLMALSLMLSVVGAASVDIAESGLAAKGVGLADETALLTEKGLLPATAVTEPVDPALLQARIAQCNQDYNTLSVDLDVTGATDVDFAAYVEKQIEAFTTHDQKDINLASDELSPLAVSYYPGTSIPTFTYVTGRTLLLENENDEGTKFYYYSYDIDDHTGYTEYLIDYYGWTFYDYTVSDDGSFIMAFLVKNGLMLPVVADFELGCTIIMIDSDLISSNEVTSVTLNISKRTMIVGNIFFLEATVSPTGASNATITWSSSNTSVATVSSEGIVTAKKAGTATITAKTANGKKATCSITVKNLVLDYYPDTNVPTFTCVTGKSLSSTSEKDGLIMHFYELDVHSHTDYEAFLATKDGWTLVKENVSEDSSMFTVMYEKNGFILFLIVDFEFGVSTVAYSDPTNISVSDVSLNKTSTSLFVGETERLYETITPSNASNQSVNWSSSNTAVAMVSSNGTITAKKAGTATITIVTEDGNYEASCLVTVKPLTPLLEVESVYGQKGKTVDVTIKLLNNPGMALLSFNINYNSSILTLKSATLGEVFTGELDCQLSTIPFVFNVYSGTSDKTNNGTLVTLQFEIDDNCKDGTYPISLSNIECLNIDEIVVNLTATNGAITVRDALPGDVNGDGSVTRSDLLRLAKHFSGYTVEIDEIASDVTGDGSVTRSDLLRLAKYFSGFEVELGN